MNTTYYHNSTNYSENTIETDHYDILIIVGMIAFIMSVFACVARNSSELDVNSSVNRTTNGLLMENGNQVITV
jgi:hypothetical protein